MKLHVQSKLRRYIGMFRAISNWPEYLFDKLFPGSDYHLNCRNGLRIKVPRHTISAFKEIFFDQTYTKELPTWWWQIKEPVVLDIGANAGYFSLLMGVEKPDAIIHAFEPMPANFKILSNQKAQFPDLNLHVHQKAVSGRGEKLVLNYDHSEQYTTTAGVVQITSNDTHQMEVDAIPLAIVLEENHLDRIDFLKLDCEGSEYDILYSLPQEIFDKVTWMAIETHSSPTLNHNHEALLNFIQEKGFQTRAEVGSQTGFIWATPNFQSPPNHIIDN